MLKIYNIPGKLLAELWYLWPKKGEVWASGRRRDHSFVHFLYSTIFYVVAAIAFSVFFAAGTSLQSASASDESSAPANEEGYLVSLNADGAILTQGHEKIYIGNGCDVVSTFRGDGQWRQLDGHLVMYFSTENISIPAADVKLEGCFEELQDTQTVASEAPLLDNEEVSEEPVTTEVVASEPFDFIERPAFDRQQSSRQKSESNSQLPASAELVTVEVNHLDRSLDQAYIDAFVRANQQFKKCAPTGTEKFLPDGLFIQLSCQNLR
ncbi:hypothetical protein [uncultured Parasphingorhabdus sp.]|uniref:hypothetical protein n=1 Tax=uncultured Parasphingorhabdus sp. TaxID=2709694 RepID=UPI002AA85E94|nr:hypothetical protein [uncultured Parasphingorhabdus sp.]